MCQLPRNRPSRNPKRLVEILEQDGTLNARLMETGGKSFKYVAVSHRWGNLEGLKTTKSTIVACQEFIAAASLSSTFQDAMTVAHTLGISHLWIDALAIIQDDEHDWEEECPKMASIYENAVLTIFAARADSTKSGILQQRPQYQQKNAEECDLCYRDAEGIPKGKVTLVPGKGYDESSIWIGSTLGNRGWIAQEEIFSRRKVQFGDDQISWRCHEFAWFEKSLQPIDSVPRADIGRLFVDQTMSAAEPWPEWMDFVTQYSSRQFTKELDRLPAISGIAQYISELTKSRYVAGHWLETLLTSLLWWRDEYRPTLKALGPYMAPSWSWVTCEGRCKFFEKENKGNSRYGAHQFPATSALAGGESSSGRRPLAAILDAQTEPVGLDPYGRLQHGHLKVKDLIKRVEEEISYPNGGFTLAPFQGWVIVDKRESPIKTFSFLLLYKEGPETRKWHSVLLQCHWAGYSCSLWAVVL